MARDMVHEFTYPHAPERVWQALTTPETLSRWLMPAHDFKPVKGQKFEFRSDPMPGWDGIVRAEVLEVQAPRRMVWAWWGGANKPRTTVTWTLEPVEGGTRLRLVHAGLTGWNGFVMRTMMNNGWGRMLRERLPAAMEPLAAR